MDEESGDELETAFVGRAAMVPDALLEREFNGYLVELQAGDDGLAVVMAKEEKSVRFAAPPQTTTTTRVVLPDEQPQAKRFKR